MLETLLDDRSRHPFYAKQTRRARIARVDLLLSLAL